jgi:hypothetical protein
VGHARKSFAAASIAATHAVASFSETGSASVLWRSIRFRYDLARESIAAPVVAAEANVAVFKAGLAFEYYSTDINVDSG